MFNLPSFLKANILGYFGFILPLLLGGNAGASIFGRLPNLNDHYQQALATPTGQVFSTPISTLCSIYILEHVESSKERVIKEFYKMIHQGSPAVRQFNRENYEFTAITDQNNEKYERTVQDPALMKGKLVMEIDNSGLKHVNDIDKVFATTLTNYVFKLTIEEIKLAFGDQAILTLVKGADFKSIRIIVDDNEANLLKIQRIYAKTVWKLIKRFHTDFKIFLKLLAPHGPGVLTADIKTLFTLGVGHDKFAHYYASRSIRQSRGEFQKRVDLSEKEWLKPGARIFSNSKEDKHLYFEEALAWNRARIALAANKEIRDSGIMVENKAGELVMSVKALNIFRNNTGKRRINPLKVKAENLMGNEFNDALKSRLDHVFNVHLTPDDIQNIRDYYHKLDTMIPPFFSKRQQVLLDSSVSSVMSIDRIMGGALNAFMVSTELANLLTPPSHIAPSGHNEFYASLSYDDVIENAIVGIDNATAIFKQWGKIVPQALFKSIPYNNRLVMFDEKHRESFNGWHEEVAGKAGNGARPFEIISGDDVTLQFYAQLLEEYIISMGLAMLKLPDDYREFTRVTGSNLGPDSFLGEPQQAIDFAEKQLKKVEDGFLLHLPQTTADKIFTIYHNNFGKKTIHIFSKAELTHQEQNIIRAIVNGTFLVTTRPYIKFHHQPDPAFPYFRVIKSLVPGPH